jgi:hypothetical protein
VDTDGGLNVDKKRWEAKIFRREEALAGRTITVWGM